MSESNEAMRPRRPRAIGQRWASGGEPAREYTITGKSRDTWTTCRPGEIDDHDASYTHDGACCWFTEFWFESATFLGYAPGYGPGSPPEAKEEGVRVGQRRENKPARLGPIVVLSVTGDMCKIRYERSGRTYNAPVLHVAEQELLPATPVTSGVPREAVAAASHTLPTCRSCGADLLPANRPVADGCPCNSGRGVNHGIVAPAVCTCSTCDPDQAGSSRWRPTVKPHLREVRTTGGAWINYDSMVDPDPFEAYPLRRLDGVVAAVVEETGIRIVGWYIGHGEGEGERKATAKQRALDDARRARASKPLAVPQSHCRNAGQGVWSLRAPDVDVRR